MSDIAKVTLITDDSGNPSMMRVGFFFGLFASFVITLTLLYGKIFKNIPITVTDTGLVLTWLVSAFGGKAVQKFAENKGGNQN